MWMKWTCSSSMSPTRSIFERHDRAPSRISWRPIVSAASTRLPPPRWPSPRWPRRPSTPPSTTLSSPRRTLSSPIWSASFPTSAPTTTPLPRLIIAQRSADDSRHANANATETIQDARDEAQRIMSIALTQIAGASSMPSAGCQDDREDARESTPNLLKDLIISDASAGCGASAPTCRLPPQRWILEYDVKVPDLAGKLRDRQSTWRLPLAMTPQAPAAVVAAASVASLRDLSGFGGL